MQTTPRVPLLVLLLLHPAPPLPLTPPLHRPRLPQLGAECRSAVGEGVTHVVAADPTDKTRWARRHGCHVVSPSWLAA